MVTSEREEEPQLFGCGTKVDLRATKALKNRQKQNRTICHVDSKHPSQRFASYETMEKDRGNKSQTSSIGRPSGTKSGP